MTVNGWMQILFFFALVLAVTKPLGIFMARVFNRERTFNLIFQSLESKFLIVPINKQIHDGEAPTSFRVYGLFTTFCSETSLLLQPDFRCSASN